MGEKRGLRIMVQRHSFASRRGPSLPPRGRRAPFDQQDKQSPFGEGDEGKKLDA